MPSGPNAQSNGLRLGGRLTPGGAVAGPVHILFENPDWMPPLRRALADRGLPVREWFLEGGTIDIGSDPPEGIWLNRMSPSSHTRGHQGGVQLARDLIPWLESKGRRVLNGSKAFALELSKVRQHTALEAAGIRTPRTIAAVGKEHLRAAGRKMSVPFITKDNQGGKGLGVKLFRDLAAFDRYLDSDEYVPGPDGVTLVQQYVEPPAKRITRVEIVGGKYLYSIHSSTEGGFELCPADACSAGDQFCPTTDAAKPDAAQPASKFALARGFDDPIIHEYVGFTREWGFDLAGIEFVEDAAGTKWTYDVNGTTNFSTAVESANGLDGMGAVADLCARELQRARRPELARTAA